MEQVEKLKLVVIFGGKSTEHDVSCMSAYNILSAIDHDKYSVTTLGVARDGTWHLFEGEYEMIKNGEWLSRSCPATFTASDGFFASKNGERIHIPCDIVFPAVHGGYCEDGRLQGLLDMCGMKYVGSGAAASAVCMDKFFTKAVLATEGIPMVRYELVTKRQLADNIASVTQRVENSFSYPVFVKPCNAGSSIGVSKACSADELTRSLKAAFEYDERVLVEEFIDGREIEVGVMGNEDTTASVCGEIDPGAVFYDYDTKYHADTASYFIPARISDECSSKVRKYALKIFAALGCRGLSRVDFFVDKNERIVFNEINTLPGFTSISMYPSLFKAEGMTYSEIIDRLIELALNKHE